MAEGAHYLEAKNWATQQACGAAAARSQDAEPASAGREEKANTAAKEDSQACQLKALLTTRISESEGQEHQRKGRSFAD